MCVPCVRTSVPFSVHVSVDRTWNNMESGWTTSLQLKNGFSLTRSQTVSWICSVEEKTRRKQRINKTAKKKKTTITNNAMEEHEKKPNCHPFHNDIYLSTGCVWEKHHTHTYNSTVNTHMSAQYTLLFIAIHRTTTDRDHMLH